MTNKIKRRMLFQTEPDMDLIRGKYGGKTFSAECRIMLDDRCQ
jgi:hypothetical protein